MQGDTIVDMNLHIYSVPHTGRAYFFVLVKSSTPKTEEQCAGLGAHLVVWHNVCKLPSHIANMFQDGVTLLPLAHQHRVGIDLCSTWLTSPIHLNYAKAWR